MAGPLGIDVHAHFFPEAFLSVVEREGAPSQGAVDRSDPRGPVLAVRPFCHNDHYWQVYFDGNRLIREALAEAGFPAPMPAQLMITQQPGA